MADASELFQPLASKLDQVVLGVESVWNQVEASFQIQEPESKSLNQQDQR